MRGVGGYYRGGGQMGGSTGVMKIMGTGLILGTCQTI